MNWLEEIYRGHGESLFQLAWLILRDQPLAEDAVHSGFLKLASLQSQKQAENSNEQFKPNNPLNYARQTIRNTAIDMSRARGIRTTELLEENDAISTDQSTELQFALEELLRKLSIKQREVIEYRLRLGMSFKEISELLDEPLSTVSSRFQRTLEFLRKENEVHDE